MPQDSTLNGFLEQIHAEVSARAAEAGDSIDETLRECFTAILLEDLTEYGIAGDPQVCPVNERAGRGNAVADAIDVDPDEGRVDVFVSIYRGNRGTDTITGTDIKNASKRAQNLLRHIEKGWQPSSGLDTDGELLFEHVRSCLPTTSEVRIFVLSDCIARDTAETTEQVDGRRVRCQVWDVRRHHRIRSSGQEYESVEIDAGALTGGGIPCLSGPHAGGDAATYLSLIPGEFLYRAYDEFGPRLLELNVRSFLQLRGAVNRGIRETLINNPERFLAYNNGLTATVEELEIEADADGVQRITRMRGFQVVNGAQTMATIHSTLRKDGVDLSEVFVQAKITWLKNPDLARELVPNISRYANTQNRVNAADLSANDPLHVRIEHLSETVWAPGEQTRWFYERARGQYQVARSKVVSQPAKKRQFDKETPTSQKFTKTDLGKYINAWDQLPHVVGTGAQKNFTTLMKSFPPDFASSIDEGWYRNLISKAIVYKAAEKIARELKLPAYRVNAVTYTVSLLSYRTQKRLNLERVWSAQSASEALLETMRAWMPEVHRELRESAGTRNVTEWCKKEDCWRRIQTLGVELPKKLEDELALDQPLPTVGSKKGKSGKGLSSEDRENIARVMTVPAERWLEIHSTGMRLGILDKWMAGIAHTLLGYASADWANVPSAKQAKQGVRIIELLSGHLDEDA